MEIVHSHGQSANFEIHSGKFEAGDKMMLREIWEGNYYFENAFPVPAGLRVLDIGGHVGFFSVLADKLKAKRIVCFEPNAKSYELLLKNLYQNKCFNVIPVFGAVSDWSEWDKIYQDQDELAQEINTGKTVLGKSRIHKGETYEGQKCPVFSIYHVFKIFGQFDYIKLDCEGSEYDILYKMNFNDEFWSSVKYITLEFHGNDSQGAQFHAKKLFDYLSKSGFNCKMDYSYGDQGRIQARKV